MDEEERRELLVKRARAMRHKMCTWPAICMDATCALGWFIFDYYATADERANFGNVGEYSKDHHP